MNHMKNNIENTSRLLVGPSSSLVRARAALFSGIQTIALVSVISLVSGAFCLDPLQEFGAQDRRPKCDAKKQFECKPEGRCIPIDARCDFTEQCLSGLDEVGCAPQYCDFSQDLCNWSNNLSFITNSTSDIRGDQHKQQKAATRARKSANFWRRYYLKPELVTGDSRKRHHKGLDRGDELLWIESRLDRLLYSSPRSKGRHTKLLYAPLIFKRQTHHRIGAEKRQTKFESPLGPPTELAAISSPTIGQTGSMCQLRFMYALLPGEPSNCQSGACNRGTSAKTKVTLNLWASRTSETSITGKDRDSTKEGVSRELLWTRSTESDWSAVTWAGSNSDDTTSWLLGLVELSHTRQLQLTFEASATLIESNADGEQPKADVSSRPLMNSINLVALDWIEFHRCSWPREAHQAKELSGKHWNEKDDDYQDDSYLDDLDTLSPESDAQAEAEIEAETESSSQPSSGGCFGNQYRCANDICLDHRKLCNFVNDCMTETELDEIEDEASHLCSSIPGMQNFEQIDADELATTPGGAADNLDSEDISNFWTLDGNWPKNQVSVRHNHLRMRHLPLHDHTHHTSQGRFLSLGIRSPRNSLTEANLIGEAAGKSLYWAYVKSPWMEKLDAGKGDCRVKFFFNLVSADHLDPTTDTCLPFKLYLVVDHFVASKSSAGIKSLSKTVDSIMLTHTIDHKNLLLDGDLSYIEYPGVDFWREANVDLVGLDEGDRFQVRIAVIVELDTSVKGQADASLNIDDLSTHFGCGKANSSEMVWWPIETLKRPVRLTDYLAVDGKIGPSRRRGRLPALADELETHKLILYVFGVLSSIIGVIFTIVFVLVPYVERVTMNHRDGIPLEMNGPFEVPIGCSPAHNSFDGPDLTSGSDWDRLSRYVSSRSAALERPMAESIAGEEVTSDESGYNSRQN